MVRRVITIWAAAALAAAAAPVATAHGASYQQFVCQHPDGTPAPADQWRAAAFGGTATLCDATRRWAAVKLYSPVQVNAYASIAWEPPTTAGVVLLAARLRRSVSVVPSATNGTFVYRVNAPTGAYQAPDVREQCHSRAYCSQIGESDLFLPSLPNGALSMMLICQDAECVSGSVVAESWAMLFNATLTLGDDVPPTFSTVAGSLTSPDPIWGFGELTYRAADVGGGVYRQKLLVDGKTVVEEVADANAGKCHDAMPGWGTAYEFDYTVPCATKVDGRISFDLNRVAPGQHTISASIEDAAGNVRSIYEGEITVLSDPARRAFDAQGVLGLVNPLGDRPGLVPNGAGASRDATVGAYVRRVRHGRQRGFPTRATATYPGSPALVVRVKAGTRPIAGAVVSVLEREAGTQTWRATRTATTSRLGGVSLRLSPGPSRDIRFAYVADSESPTFVSSRTLSVRIKPRASLSASPRRLRTGQRVRFSGRVTGGAIPATGLALSLQASGLDGRWLTFKTIRTTPGGRFHAAYRFSATTGSVRYRFRIRVLRQGGYPFAAAYSRPVSVRVRG